MKTLVLEVDDSIYPKVKEYLDLLPKDLCHAVDDLGHDSAETEELEAIRVAYRAGREEEFEDWEQVREKF